MFQSATGQGTDGRGAFGSASKLTFLGLVSVATAAAIVLLADPAAPPGTDRDATGDTASRADVSGPSTGPDSIPITPVHTGTEHEPDMRLLAHIATRARMLAERDGATRLKLPAKFSRMSRRAMQIATNEQRLLDARRLSFDSRQRDLRAKIEIVRDEIAGFETQRKAKQKEIGFIKEELKALEKLHTKQLTNIARLLSLRREETRALWDIGSLDAAVARSHLTIKDIEAQIHDERHNLVIEAEKEIRIIEIEIGELIKSPEALSEDLVAMATAGRQNGPPR